MSHLVTRNKPLVQKRHKKCVLNEARHGQKRVSLNHRKKSKIQKWNDQLLIQARNWIRVVQKLNSGAFFTSQTFLILNFLLSDKKLRSSERDFMFLSLTMNKAFRGLYVSDVNLGWIESLMNEWQLTEVSRENFSLRTHADFKTNPINLDSSFVVGDDDDETVWQR